MFVFERELWYNDLQRNPRSGGGVESFPPHMYEAGGVPQPAFWEKDDAQEEIL